MTPCLRRLASLAAALGVSGLAQACDLDVLSRPAGVADYIAAARPCLASPPEGFLFDARLEDGFLSLINNERANHGLAALAPRPALVPAARFHGLDMAANDFFAHLAPDGREPADRLAAFDRTAFVSRSAENIATVAVSGGRIDPDMALARLHANLMASPGHRANILDPKSTHAGLGVVRTKRGVWVTQAFVTLEATLPEAAPLRLTQASRLRAPEGLTAWTFVRFEAAFEDGSARPVIDPDLPAGDAVLTTFATQAGETPGARYTIRFPGPAVTLAR